MKFMVFDDPDWDFRSWDYGRDLPVALERTGPALDANDPDLRPLRDAGGKLLLYHGWSDADISPLGTIDYYEDVVRDRGRRRGRARRARGDAGVLPPVHGAGHGPLPGRSGTGYVRRPVGPRGMGRTGAALRNGSPPRRSRAAKVVRTRPLCPYPQVAQWSGAGSTDDAANFRCVTPE